MDSPRLDRKIILERFTFTTDPGSGEQIKTWSVLGPANGIWASHRRASARETLAAAEVAAASSDVFEIRYDSAWGDLSPIDRLIFEGVTHQIVSVAEIGRRQGVRIETTARAEKQS